MKNLVFIISILFANNFAIAQPLGGSEGVGGGDLCEKRIQDIRDDLLQWMMIGGPQTADLQLPEGLTFDQYRKSMSKYLEVKKAPNGTLIPATKIECIHSSPKVDGFEKVCRFDSNKMKGPAKITCYSNRFIGPEVMSEEDQYELIHHEYAGLAGVELPNGNQSDYVISRQISGFLQVEVVKKLAVKKSAQIDPRGMNLAGPILTSPELAAYLATDEGRQLAFLGISWIGSGSTEQGDLAEFRLEFLKRESNHVIRCSHKVEIYFTLHSQEVTKQARKVDFSRFDLDCGE